MTSANRATVQVDRLLRRVRLLKLAARANVAGLLRGDYQSSIRGQGLIFHELRRYSPGEPARRIDWNVTARLGEPYVRVSQEERRRDVFLALDVSPSMHTGFHSRLKLEYAVELAATLALAAIEGGDRLGYLFFADRVIEHRRPRGGRRRLFEVLRSLLGAGEPWRRPVAESDPRAALHAIQRHRGRKFVLFMISDFIDHDLPEDLKYVQARHDVSLLHVFDPVEAAVTASQAPVRFTGTSPEVAVRGAGRRWPKHGAGSSGVSPTETAAFLRTQAARHEVAVESISTAEPVADALGRYFAHRRLERRGRSLGRRGSRIG